MRKGAIILCGGKSSRMGRDKATLPFGPELMLQRVVRRMVEVVDVGNIVVVGAPNQRLPELPVGVLVAHDGSEFHGPLAGLATGLRALADRPEVSRLEVVEAVYVTGCDVPLLVPAFVRRMFDVLGDYAIAVPYDGQHHHPLAAVYRPSVLRAVERLLADGQMRPRFLFEVVRTKEVSVEDLRSVDPELATLENLNYVQDYRVALTKAGFAAGPES